MQVLNIGELYTMNMEIFNIIEVHCYALMFITEHIFKCFNLSVDKTDHTHRTPLNTYKRLITGDIMITHYDISLNSECDVCGGLN